MASQAVSSVRLPYVDTRFNSPLPQPFSSLAWEIVDLIFRNLSVVEWNRSRCLCKSFKQYVDLRLYSTEKLRSLFLHANPRVLPFIFPRLSHQVVDYSEDRFIVNVFGKILKINRITGERSSIDESGTEVWGFSNPLHYISYPISLVSTHGNTRTIDYFDFYDRVHIQPVEHRRFAHYNKLKVATFIEKDTVTCVTGIGTLFQFTISSSEFIRAHHLLNTHELHKQFVKSGFSAKPFFLISMQHPTVGDGIFAYRQSDFSFYQKISTNLAQCIYQINDRLIIITKRASPDVGVLHNPKHDLSILKVSDTSLSLEYIFALDDCYGNSNNNFPCNPAYFVFNNARGLDFDYFYSDFRSYIAGHHENFLVLVYPNRPNIVFSVVDIKCGKIITSYTYRKVVDSPETVGINKYPAWVIGGAIFIIADEIELKLSIYCLPQLLPISTIDLTEVILKEECIVVDGIKESNQGVKSKVMFNKFIKAVFNKNEILLSYSYILLIENRVKSRTISIKGLPEVNSTSSKTLH